MPGIPPYNEADEAAAREVVTQSLGRGRSSVALVREIAGAVAQARREGGEAALAPFHALFAGEPDTSCRTTWRGRGHSVLGPNIECVEVPLSELRATFEEAERVIEGQA